MDTVIFACVQNAGRSQMAAAFFNALAAPNRAHAISAGTRPASHVHPVVIEVMQECGIDLSGKQPQALSPALVQGASLLITMGCSDECPYAPGLQLDDWPLADPAGRPIGEVRGIRDEIRQRVAALISAHHWSAQPPSLD